MSDWQPIETAPKDETDVLLFVPGGAITVGNWDDDAYAKRPRPYWSTERGWLFGRAYDRAHQPTHWMPLPEPPQ